MMDFTTYCVLLVVSVITHCHAADYPCYDEIMPGRLPPLAFEIQQPIDANVLAASGNAATLTGAVGFVPIGNSGSAGNGPVLRTDISFGGGLPRAALRTQPIAVPDYLRGQRYDVGVDFGPTMNLAPATAVDEGFSNNYRYIPGVPQIVRERTIVPRTQPLLGENRLNRLSKLFAFPRQLSSAGARPTYRQFSTVPIAASSGGRRQSGCSCAGHY